MRYLLCEVFQGDENAPNTHLFVVGPFGPKDAPQDETFSPAAQFKRGFYLGVDKLNEKHQMLDLSEHLEVVVDELEAEQRVDALLPDISMRGLILFVEERLDEHKLRAA